MKKTSIIASALVLLSAILNADITIKNGWQLLGATQDMDKTIFENTCVDYIWKYDAIDINNAQWQVHIANAAAYNDAMTPITSLVKGEGYWVKGNGDCTIPLPPTIRVRFFRRHPEIVTDHKTGLQWQDDAAVNSVTKPWRLSTSSDVYDTSGDTAATYCSSLALGGYEDWRLPTFLEFQSLDLHAHGYIDTLAVFNPHVFNFDNDINSDNDIPTAFMPSDKAYWNSDSNIGAFTDSVALVIFPLGDTGFAYKKDFNYVRCVRAGH